MLFRSSRSAGSAFRILPTWIRSAVQEHRYQPPNTTAPHSHTCPNWEKTSPCPLFSARSLANSSHFPTGTSRKTEKGAETIPKRRGVTMRTRSTNQIR